MAQEYHAFYEVSPYYVLLDERPVGLPATTRTVQAGFHVDVYGIRTEDTEPAMPPPQEYALGLRRVTETCRKCFAACQRFLLSGSNSVLFDRHHR